MTYYLILFISGYQTVLRGLSPVPIHDERTYLRESKILAPSVAPRHYLNESKPHIIPKLYARRVALGSYTHDTGSPHFFKQFIIILFGGYMKIRTLADKAEAITELIAVIKMRPLIQDMAAAQR